MSDMSISIRKIELNQTPTGYPLQTGLLVLACLLVPVTAIGGGLEAYSNKGEPAFSLADLEGNTHVLSDYRDKVVLVNFWASWCPPCIREMPELQRLKKHFADRPFEVLTINVAEQKYRVRKFTRSIKLDLPVLLDASSKTYNRWGVNILPTSFLVDIHGQIRYRVRGNPGWDDAETLSVINAMTSEQKRQSDKQPGQ
jgi:thiol-disulfide isomerase/thioredoxin